jgi:antitoxin HicB
VPNLNDHPFEIRPLASDEGGGLLISYPSFAVCISDEEKVEEAMINGLDALKATIAALKSKKLPVPLPHGRPARSKRPSPTVDCSA